MILVTNHTSHWFATEPSTARSFGPEPMSPEPAC